MWMCSWSANDSSIYFFWILFYLMFCTNFESYIISFFSFDWVFFSLFLIISYNLVFVHIYFDAPFIQTQWTQTKSIWRKEWGIMKIGRLNELQRNIEMVWACIGCLCFGIHSSKNARWPYNNDLEDWSWIHVISTNFLNTLFLARFICFYQYNSIANCYPFRFISFSLWLAYFNVFL